MTIGIDGEKRDLIFGNDKPLIETVKGDIFLTSENLIAYSDGSFSVLHVFPWKTGLGKLILLKTIRKGFVEISGPENNIQLEQILSFIKDDLNLKTFLIDGAINRITQISSSLNAGFYYVCSINHENVHRSIDKMKMISFMNKIDEKKETLNGETTYIHKGAFTKKNLQEIPEKIENIVIEDFTKVFLSVTELN
ncbi:MAG: hypothetical protein PF518_18485, partial [Spirochaetaceae bacterium]|nr:hypothetical protein [Spirochaetaceae bacterium]